MRDGGATHRTPQLEAAGGGRVSLRQFPLEPPHPCCAGRVPLHVACPWPPASTLVPAPPPGGRRPEPPAPASDLTDLHDSRGKTGDCAGFLKLPQKNHQTGGLKTTLACPLTVRGSGVRRPVRVGGGDVVTTTSTFTHPPPAGVPPCLTGSPVRESGPALTQEDPTESLTRPQPRRS